MPDNIVDIPVVVRKSQLGNGSVSSRPHQSTKKGMVKNFMLNLLLFLSPFVVLTLGVYCIYDPFKVLYHYDSYYKSGKPLGVYVNRSFVSVETFKNNYGKYKYNSFIFGNSRSLYYRVQDWQTHLNGAQGFHADASSENLSGLEQFVTYLSNYGAHIDNALFIVDYQLLENKTEPGHLFIKHPDLSGQNTFLFQAEFFSAFLDQNFFRSFIDWKLSKQIKPYMKESRVLEDKVFDYYPATNELLLSHYERIIDGNKDDYYRPRAGLFYRRSEREEMALPVIKNEQVALLKRIKEILNTQQTRFKIIISPLYDQKKLNTADYNLLVKIFGKERVFNFSGKNAITDNVYNYYETSHYRPHVAKQIMDSIYSKQ